jgi:vancomycin permeability regulator SanA
MNHKAALNALRGVTVAIPAVFIVFAAMLAASGLRDDIHTADVAVVLGNAVQPNGQPSPRLKARLDKAVQLYRQGLFPNVVVSGGVDAEGTDEAIAMKQYLIAQGLPSPHIFVDSNGRTTYLTAKNLTPLVKAKQWKSVFVISQYFHIPRTRLALQKFGLAPIYAAHANFFELRDFYSIARETIGFGAYLIRGYD